MSPIIACIALHMGRTDRTYVVQADRRIFGNEARFSRARHCNVRGVPCD